MDSKGWNVGPGDDAARPPNLSAMDSAQAWRAVKHLGPAGGAQPKLN